MSATTGMSSPPVASGSAAVGRTVSTWKARVRASVDGRRRLSARSADEHGEDEELDPCVGEARLDPAPAREAEDDHAGQVGVVELVDRHVVLVDEDVAVAVDHLVGLLAVGDPRPCPLDDHHLGLDVLGGVRPPIRQTTSTASGTRVAPKSTTKKAAIRAARERRRARSVRPSAGHRSATPATAMRRSATIGRRNGVRARPPSGPTGGRGGCPTASAVTAANTADAP